MNEREIQEDRERKFLAPSAAMSFQSSRKREEKECSIRTSFQRDRDRIIHSKAFRRLKHKTQVFISPGGDHYRTRLTHTLEVSQISRTIARALHLNEDLTEAIALGHDLGHTPFGHAGEEALNSLLSGGFRHNEQSLRVVDFLENPLPEPGLNLTYAVCDGILCHTGARQPETLEGQIVKIADRVAYINHDIDDALRAGLITNQQLPQEAISLLGQTSSHRIDGMVRDLIQESRGQECIQMSPPVGAATQKLRTFLFQKIYQGERAQREEARARRLLILLFEYYMENWSPWEREFSHPLGKDLPPQVIIADYIAGMTDRYALKKGQSLLLPRPWLE